MKNLKKLLLNYFHFIRSQLPLTKIKTTPFTKIKIILGAIFNIFLKPLQLINQNFYFRLRKFVLSEIYKNIQIEIQNKKFKIRDDIDLMTLLADEGIDEFFKIRDKIFLDIGAHIGKYSILYSDFYEKIYAFEPEPDNFNLLKENIRLNNLKGKIFPFQLALSDKTSKIEFYLSPYSVANSLIKNEGYKKILVDTITLDEFLKQEKINFNNISCIKIDVEGAEDMVIKGMEKSFSFLRCKIIIEILENNSENFKFISEFIKKYNFKIKKIKGDYYLAYYENSSS
ncbi:MAG: hypothetical protein KatS3mg097_507 [Candidatus Parcubacteria bacterium]|nr:MAG: hypothetical protein KatS3mg097_507 [Candidatus Parcubacteria bacterium]